MLLDAITRKLPVAALTIASYDPAYDTDGKICAIALEATTTVMGGVTAEIIPHEPSTPL